MEKKASDNNGGKPPKNPKKDTIFGPKIEINLTPDDSEKLVGGIVEKGINFSEDDSFFVTPLPSTMPPLPSALPFPVARHRSHGPHWTPNVNHCEAGGVGVDDDDLEEDNDPTNYDPLAVFAKPIIKKKKKGLDLSRWRDIVPKNVSSDTHEKKKYNVQEGVEKRISDDSNLSINVDSIIPSIQGAPETGGPAAVVTSLDMELDRMNKLSSDESKFNAVRSELKQFINAERNSVVINGSAEGNSTIAEGHCSLSGDLDVEMEDLSAVDMLDQRFGQPSETFGPRTMGQAQGHRSLESQIDTENRTLLEKMSAEEIAEAQEEIKKRINPQLLQILKKRGLEKMKKLGSSSSSDADDVPSSGAMQADKPLTKDEKISSVSQSIASPSMATPSKLVTETKLDKSVQSSSSKSGNLWDIWSKRVEAVRTLRFSIEGTVIEGNSLDQAYNKDTAAERDFLRTEGDPGAAGYTIKEALALARSVIPGQRALALHLLASVLTKALQNLLQLDFPVDISNEKNRVDWEAVWAYALGPEPELALSLRLALDDNHNSVVLASTKVIQCVLACEIHDNFFNRLEKMKVKDWYTAPVFRSRPDIRHGFLSGGFWKYSTKPSNILLPDEEIRDDENKAEHTIQDDTVVAGQDFAAGLVRMEILPRFLHLLETEPMRALEECILSVLVAIARHSPTCANAIWNCERLVQTIVNKFTDAPEIQASKIKSVTLLRVLSQSSKGACIEFIQKGLFQTLTLQLFRVMPSIDEWIRSGKDKCKLFSELIIEQLRLWKVCVMHGYCISYFTSFFPALCLWLRPSTFDKLFEINLFHEFASISTEVYLVLETLARRLPDPHSTDDINQKFQGSSGDEIETWCWNDVGPMIDMALKWLEIMKSEVVDKFVSHNNASSLLWVLSAVMEMLNTILVKVTPGEVFELKGSKSGRNLPDFVAKVLLQFSENNILDLSGEYKDGSFVEKLCQFRRQSDSELSLASVCCLRGLHQFMVSADKLIQLTGENELFISNKILHRNIFNCSLNEWREVIGVLVKSITSEWESANSVEVFGRGGPAPGVGVGWGVFGGGFWSLTITLVQADARLLIELFRNFYSLSLTSFSEVKEHNFMLESINSVLAMCLVAGPGDGVMVHNAFDFLCEIPVLNFLDQCIFHFLQSYKGIQPYTLDNKDSDFSQFGKTLASHFRTRWLSVKKRKKHEVKAGRNRSTKMAKMSGNSLDAIPEDMGTSAVSGENGNSLTVEWVRQRLPLPIYWLLSPITTIGDINMNNASKSAGISHALDPMEYHEVSKAGLFFLLGVEAMSSKLPGEVSSPVRKIPLIWKLHALSVPLLVGMGVLEDESNRYMYEALQRHYTQHLNELWLKSMKDVAPKSETTSGTNMFGVGCLRFQSDIHENYSTFIENLVEQFAAISYGDVIFGRQVAIYLHRLVDAPVRLSTWNALSNAHALELLPPLADCLFQAEGYLEPVEDDEGILEAYVKSWISGPLDRAATRNSMTYIMVLHHVTSFVFINTCGEKQMLRKKLVKLLLRDYSRKQEHEAMMLDFVQFHPSNFIQKAEPYTSNVVQMDYTGPRFEMLKDCCEGNSQLLTAVEKLKSSMSKK